MYLLGTLAHNLFTSSLRKYAGPKLWPASRLPFLYYLATGELPQKVHQLHLRYGPIVRVSPDQLSYTDDAAWKEVYGLRPGKIELPKQEMDKLMVPAPDGIHGILTADHEPHARYRRLLAPAFSTRALEEQESLVSSHIDRFIQSLTDNATKGPLDMMTWFVWLTFDIIGDLSFGESFGCLEKQDYHPWIKAIRINIERSPWFQALGYYPSVLKMLLRNLPPSVEKARLTDYNLARAWVQKRLDRGSREKPDFMSFLLKKDGTENALQLNEFPPQMLAMVAAGHETTAS